MKQENPTPSAPEQSFYQTGNTDRKKSHRGLYTVLIMAVILLVGVVSVMGLLNIQLFRRVLELDSNTDSFAFRVTRVYDPEQPTVPQAPKEFSPGVPQLQLQPAPPAIANTLQPEGLPLQKIYAQTISGIVAVISNAGTGTGVVISEDGYLITDRHLLGDGDTAQICFHDGSQYIARLVGIDLLSDLALLDVDAEGLTPVEFCEDSGVQVGDPVVTIGNAFGAELPGTMTTGIISAIHRDLDLGSRYLNLLQTDAVPAYGNAGGPLLNSYGQVIGINGAQLGAHFGKPNAKTLGFAIPSSTVKEVVDQLLQQGYVSRRAALGFTAEQVSAFDQLYYKVPAGLFITSADADVPLQTGDILLKFAGRRIGDLETLQHCLTEFRAGDTVTITIYRGGQQQEMTITLKEVQ